VRAEEGGPIVPVLVSSLADSDRGVQEAAALGLGILGGDDSLRPLIDVALDNEQGRAACGRGGPLDSLLRSQAILALGLTHATEALAPLTRLALAADSSREIAASAILALGLAREGAPTVTVSLVHLLDDRSLDREVRAQVPVALARLPGTAARAALPRLVQLLCDRQSDDLLARSCAIALGRIAAPEDGEVVDALCNAAAQDSDDGTREFALIAVGRLYERAAAYDDAALRRRGTAQKFLVDAVRHPTRKVLKPFAGLALGLMARGDPSFAKEKASDALVTLRRALAESFADEPDPSVAGALAISLALSGATESEPALLAQMQRSAHPLLRGHLALALGMLGSSDAIEPLGRLLAESSLPPSARIDVARGLAMLGDAGCEQRLLDLLRQAIDTPSAIAYSKALGLVGSEKSAQTLTALAQDSTVPTLQRAFAVVSLGLLGEKTTLPWNAPYRIDANFTIPLRAMDEITDIL
jgi:HEAT repeat protein